MMLIYQGQGRLFLSGLDKVDLSMAYSLPHAMMQTVCRSEALVLLVGALWMYGVNSG